MHELGKRPLSKLESLPNPAENPKKPEAVNEAPYGTSTTLYRIAHLYSRLPSGSLGLVRTLITRIEEAYPFGNR